MLYRRDLDRLKYFSSLFLKELIVDAFGSKFQSRIHNAVFQEVHAYFAASVWLSGNLAVISSSTF